MINKNILIVNEKKLVKIYGSLDADIQPTLQSYFNFLPDPKANEKDRVMQMMYLRNCLKHDRVIMQFSYPKSSKPKLMRITPYIGDNTITLRTGQVEKDGITWLANKQLTPAERLQNPEGDGTEASIFQFSTNKSTLYEFDLCGLMKKKTSFAHQFDEKQILCHGSQKMRYLVTPEAKQYLEQIEILEVTERHECNQIRVIHT